MQDRNNTSTTKRNFALHQTWAKGGRVQNMYSAIWISNGTRRQIISPHPPTNQLLSVSVTPLHSVSPENNNETENMQQRKKQNTETFSQKNDVDN